MSSPRVSPEATGAAAAGLKVAALRPEDIAGRIRAFGRGCGAQARYGNQVDAASPAEQIVSLLLRLQQLGFEHLANIVCVDWIADGRFELVYHLWSYSHHVHVQVRTRVPREEPVADSIAALWPQAQVYEQEIHEFFGVLFTGNPDLGPLFLHNWQDSPPLRKDFDSEAYARLVFGTLKEETE
jgi:NADH-quinone oxidoreductase subunit C